MLNWKTGEMRVVTRKPTKEGVHEIVFNLSLDVEVPEKTNYDIEAKIVLKESKAVGILLEDL